jgi:glucose-1-phosphate thymidylyltransferase|tara:strand:- start:2092 stop:2829 length:738 start_codon:yes stop_codon:yes gene_type:complete
MKIKAIVLAGGYGTRLYPLTENTPKPLLEVAGKPMVEHILGKLDEIDLIDRIFIVTNDKFHNHFEKWLHEFDAKIPIEIINDQTKTNEERLGAMGDINYTIKNKNIEDDILVVAGDNLFELNLQDVNDIFQEKNQDILVLFDVKDKELARQYGVVGIEDNKVVDFEEKPENPKSTLISTGIYLFQKNTINLISEYISEGNNTDKTGDFVRWLYKKNDIYAYITDETWYDIGSSEQLEEANKKFKV